MSDTRRSASDGGPSARGAALGAVRGCVRGPARLASQHAGAELHCTIYTLLIDALAR